jgi:hypothetical protein
MKKTLIALAALASVSAFAQSSVTLSGNMGFGVSQVGTGTAALGLTDGGFTFAAVEDLGGGMKVSATQAVAVKGHDNAAKSDGGSLEISGGFGSLKVGQACAGKALGEGTLGGAYSLAHAFGAGTDCTANWQYGLYTLPTMVQGLTVAARISKTAGDISVEGFSAAENSAQLRLAYASGPLSAAYYVRSNTGEIHASYDLGVAKVSFGMDTKTSTATNERTEVGVSVPMGATTFSLGYGKQKDTNIKGTQVGVKYALSKRTSIDAVYGSFTNAMNGSAAVKDASRVRLLHTF